MTEPTPTGKIARLPALLREEVNRRLNDGQTGPAICAWLNAQDSVQVIMRELFDGEEVSPQNLSSWRNGGFRRWQAEQKILTRSRERAAFSRELVVACGGNLAEGALAELTCETMDLLGELSLAREAGAEIDLKAWGALAKPLVSARAKEIATHALRQNDRRLEQNERALRLDEARFNLHCAETYLDKLDDLDARAIATSNKPRETKIADLVKHWFGEMPEGIGPQTASPQAA